LGRLKNLVTRHESFLKKIGHTASNPFQCKNLTDAPDAEKAINLPKTLGEAKG
jgi:hypothetical protein